MIHITLIGVIHVNKKLLGSIRKKIIKESHFFTYIN